MKTKKAFLLLAIASTLVLSACDPDNPSSLISSTSSTPISSVSTSTSSSSSAESSSVSSSASSSQDSSTSSSSSVDSTPSSSSDSSSISVHVHDYGDWTITVKPTLTEKGKASHKCKDDDHVEEVEIPALSDETCWTKEVVTVATHLAKGLDKYVSNYGVVEVETDKDATHIGSGKYTAIKKDDSTVELVETCVAEDGATVGEVKKTMTAKTAAEFTIDNVTKVNPFVNTEGTNTWTSAQIGNSSSSYLVLKVTKTGVLKISYSISSETSDKLHIHSTLSSNPIDEAYGGLGSWGNQEPKDNVGVFEKEVLEGQDIDIYYQKDSSSAYGKDQAIITFETSEFEYHAVTFDVNGGDSVDPSFIENGKIVGDLPTPTKTNCYFEGWFTDESLETAYDASTFNATGDTTLYAKYSDALYVTLHKENGEEDVKIPFQNGTAPTIPSESPSRTDYYFIGWFTDSEYSKEYESATATASFDLYAKWISVSDANPLYGSYKGFYVKTSSSSSSGYGWGDDDYGYGSSSSSSGSVSSSDSYAELEIDVTGNINLRTAYYSYETAKVGEIGTTGDVTIADNTKITSAYKDGNTLIIVYKYSSSETRYYFLSTENTESSTKNVSCSSINSNKNIFVTYKVGEENKSCYIDATSGTSFTTGVSFVGLDGTAVDVSKLKSSFGFKVKKDDSDIASFYSKNDGTFATTSDGNEGVYTSDDGKTLTLSGAGKVSCTVWGSSTSNYDYEVLDDGTIYAKYGASYRYIFTLDKDNKKFTYADRTIDVTFDFGYAETGETENKKVNKEVLYDTVAWFASEDNLKDISSPTREGYTFGGWYESADFSGDKVERVYYKKENTTYYAKWIKNYTVSYVEADGSAIEGCTSVSITGGKTLSSLPEPTKEGVYFDGWYKDTGLTEAFDISTPISQDTILYAKWTNPVTITKYLNNGSTDPVTQQAQLNRVPTIEEPTKEGQVFDGWYTDESLQTPFDATAKLTGDVTIYAKWKDESEFKGSYYGYNCYGTSKSGDFSSSGGLNINIDGYGDTSGKFEYSISSVDSTTNTITFVKGSETGYGKYLKAEDGRIFIITYYNKPYTTFPTDIDFLVLNTDSTQKLSYVQSKSGTVFTVKVSVNGTVTYVINIDTSAQTMTFGTIE